VFGSEGRLVRSDTNDVTDVYRWDSRTGALARVSVTTAGRQCTRPKAGSSIPGAILPRQSADGTAVLFESSCEAFSGIRDVTSGTFRHLFLRDLTRGTLQPVDVTPAGRLAYSWAISDDDGFAYGWDVSGNGSRVVFTGNRPFAPGGSGRLHVFLRAPLR
jgi:Tol biopolymer transport system component